VNTFPLIRDARCTELNLLDMIECHKGEDLKPLLQNVANSIGRWADELEKLSDVDERDRKDALRWRLLFDTDGVRIKKVDSQLHLYQDDFDVFGRLSGSRLLAVGSNRIDLVDRALGFIK
jgi:hypothetical protein